MTIGILGNGQITGLAAGGLPDGTILKADMGSGSTWAPAGTVVQVVQGSYNTVATSSSTTLVDTGLSATITPTSATNKILVIYSVNFNYSTNDSINARHVLLRNSTIIQDKPTVGLDGVQYPTNISITDACSFLDSPSTTSAVTYKTQFSRNSYAGSYGGFVNANGAGGAGSPIGISQITLMEIAA